MILIELFQLVIYMFYLDVFLSIRSCLSGDSIKSEYTSIPFFTSGYTFGHLKRRFYKKLKVFILLN